MKILLAPLNWGLGHATRSATLVKRFLKEGHEVTLAADGESKRWLERYFPTLRILSLPALNLTYSKHSSQTWAIARQLPKILIHAFRDHRALRNILAAEHFDRVVSDNRFGFFTKKTESIYITHQIFIPLPKGWHWLEPFAARLHKCLIEQYNACWIPDYADEHIALSGSLSHGCPMPRNAKYINPLSRFENTPIREWNTDRSVDVIALISGLEPQATLFEQQLMSQYQDKKERLLIIRGKTRDEELFPLLIACQTVIARSGYSTIMDLYTIGVLHKAQLYPTPGQPEQVYLATRYRQLLLCPSTHPIAVSESLG